MNILTRTALLMSLCSGWAVSLGAAQGSVQPELGSMDSSVAANQDRPRSTLAQELPRLMHRSAILDLRLHESPSPIDYELTAILLELGLEMNPDRVEIARDLAQAAWLSGDAARTLRATRQIIRLDPQDTVAQLRLISARINEKQTLEERKAMYDRFLGDAGVSIDPSVRSRLALDAALLEREAGNSAGFLERLHQSTRLDPSHKAAASLAAQYYASVRDDHAMNLEYQVRLLKADPFDANVHMAIARMLARQGAIEECKRFMYNAITLFSLETGKASEAIDELRIAIEWQADGADVPMGPLDAALNDQRASAQARIDAFVAAQLPTDELIQPSDIRFSIGINKLRILAAHAGDETEKVRSILDDLEASTSEEIGRLAQMATAPGANVNALLAQVVLRMSELNAIRTVVGMDADRIREELRAMREQIPSAADQLERIEPMVLFAEGKYEECLAEANQYRGSAVVELIRAQCFERLGRRDDAIDLYLVLAHSNVMNAYGAFSYTRLQKLGAGDRILTDAGREMISIAERVPNWIEQMIERPSSFQYLSMELEKRVYHEGEHPMITIRLQNTAPVPLSVGPNSPLNSRVLIDPVGVSTQTNGFIGETRPKVLQLDSRLRLSPRESLTMNVHADSASTDWLIDQQPGVSMRQRWRLIQGFRSRLADAVAAQQQAGSNANIYGIVNSPLALTAETPVVQRPGMQVASADANTLIAMLNGPDKDAHRRAVIAISARLINPTDADQFTSDQLDRIVRSLNDLYTRSSTEARASMMLILPQRHQHPAMMGFDDHIASSLLSDSLIESKVNPTLLACALMTRTDDVESPIFETLEHVSDANILRLAEIVRSRLQTGEPILGTVGPGIDAMVPSFDGLDY